MTNKTKPAYGGFNGCSRNLEMNNGCWQGQFQLLHSIEKRGIIGDQIGTNYRFEYKPNETFYVSFLSSWGGPQHYGMEVKGAIVSVDDRYLHALVTTVVSHLWCDSPLLHQVEDVNFSCQHPLMRVRFPIGISKHYKVDNQWADLEGVDRKQVIESFFPTVLAGILMEYEHCCERKNNILCMFTQFTGNSHALYCTQRSVVNKIYEAEGHPEDIPEHVD